MKIIKDKNNIVTHAGENLELTAEGLLGPGFRSPTVTTKTHTIEDVESIPQDWTGGYYAHDGAWTLTAFGTTQKAAKEAQDLLDSITFDTLSTDTWTIPADGTTFATVTYTSEDTVYFSVNEISHAVEPVDYVATLEITADAPGPIRVEVKDKQLIITALEAT